MPNIVSGEGWRAGELNEDAPREIAWDEFGIAGGACHFNIEWDAGPTLVSAVTEHPDFTYLIRKSAVMRRNRGGLAEVVINFYGVEDEKEAYFYSVKNSTNQQPIESHPLFKTKIGGYGKGIDAATSKNGAQFDSSGKFIGFSGTVKSLSGEPTDNPFSGIRTYYSPSVVYEETAILGAAKSVADIADNLGMIDEPPDSPQKPDLVNSVQYGGNEIRNWLKLGAPVQPIGNGFRRVTSWQLSGIRGWNEVVYARNPQQSSDQVSN